MAAESAAADVAIEASDSGPAPDWKLKEEEEGGGSYDGESDAKPSTNDMMLEGPSNDNVDSEDAKPGANSRAREVRLDQNRKVSHTGCCSYVRVLTDHSLVSLFRSWHVPAATWMRYSFIASFLIHVHVGVLMQQAARESRRRKKVMIEELQRSVIFFSRANSTLKQQNDELTRMLLQAQTMVSQMNEEGKVQEGDKDAGDGMGNAQMFNAQSSTNKGGNVPVFTSIPPMQPGATMQAMSNFQQAASVAMQQAMQGLQSIPGINMNQITAAPAGASAQQAYTDTMTALAMQQAAMAAAAGHPFNMQQGFPHPPYNPYMWPGSPQQMSQPPSNENGGEESQEAVEDDKEE